MLLQPSHKFVV